LTKRNCRLQDKTNRNGLGNRCSIRLSYGTDSKSASSGAFAGIKSDCRAV
jgi:hypothetical protein